MLSVAQAKKIIFDAAALLVESQTIALDQAPGRVLAEDIHAPLDVPPADNSAMDGIALRISDCPLAGTILPMPQRIAAGQVAKELGKNSAARIFTGAEIPSGADAVIPQEECRFFESLTGQAMVEILVPPAAGQHIRPRGGDLRRGSLVLCRGTRLGPAHIGLIASLGLTQLTVYRQLRVGLLTTGDELVAPGETLAAGQIYDSNSFMLHSLMGELGFAPILLGRLADNLEECRDRLAQAATEVDVVLTSGGVSVGEEDHVRDAVEAIGSISLWRIAVKPGKPLAVGHIGSTPFFGLPGNPVSSFVTFLLFVLPYLRVAAGEQLTEPASYACTANFERAAPGREEYLRACYSDGVVTLFAQQGSSVLSSVAHSHGLVRQPTGEAIHKGQRIDFLPYRSFF